MRSRITAVTAALFVFAVAGCADEQGLGLGRPNVIIVREFAASEGLVTLDPSFGFSLYRGAPGVPPRQRAGSVMRAAAFNLTDTVVEQLRAAGYDAIHSDSAASEPGGRALIVTGAFRRINEGYRRRVGAETANVAVDAELDYRAGTGAQPQRLMAFALDSRQVQQERVMTASARHGSDVNLAAMRIGQYIARTVIDYARRNNWPGLRR